MARLIGFMLHKCLEYFTDLPHFTLTLIHSQTNRTPIDCMRHGIPRQRHTWNMEADDKLHDAVQRYGINNWSLGLYKPIFVERPFDKTGQWQELFPNMQLRLNVKVVTFELWIPHSRSVNG